MDTQIFLSGFGIASVLGAVVQKTHFCTLGAVSDWVNFGDTHRLRAWFLAMAVAISGVVVLESLGLISLEATHPPYRTGNFAWPRFLLGGFLFGAGMALAGGCAMKNLVRLGGGNLKSLVVLAVLGGFAYLMTRTGVYSLLFHGWIAPLSIDLTRLGVAGQDLGSLLAGTADPARARLMTGGGVAGLLFFLVARSPGFRRNADQIWGGAVVGLSVVAGWCLTGGPLGREWVAAAEWMHEPPVGVGVQSFTFVNPMSEALVYLGDLGNRGLLTFGVVALVGVIGGAFAYAVLSGRFCMEWFVSWADFRRHLTGGALMGVGGVLAMGCTIGQGVTGVSTLALGSFLALGSMILGSATTMKVVYYRMLYEDASLWDALLSALADFRILPEFMRRLQAL
jgi:hypothetical protein